MPNWCNNTMVVSGPKNDLMAFIEKAEGPTQGYNSYDEKGNWEGFDSIRLQSIYNDLPELGESSELSFHQLVPVPDDVMRLPYDTSSAKNIARALGLPKPESEVYSGYRWEAENWDCKWGATEVERDIISDEEVVYEFSTPWGPPIKAIHTVSKDFPSLRFRLDYDEPGMGFRGYSELMGGDEENFHNENYEESYEE